MFFLTNFKFGNKYCKMRIHLYKLIVKFYFVQFCKVIIKKETFNNEVITIIINTKRSYFLPK